MGYLELLNNSYKTTREFDECPTRLEYLSDYIFDFTTYDAEISELFAKKAIEVCEAINNRATFEYIKDLENYKWFLIMCNMPFFIKRLDWGTSIRGAWWEKDIEINSCGLWLGDEQITESIKFTTKDWELFISAIVEFARSESQ